MNFIEAVKEAQEGKFIYRKGDRYKGYIFVAREERLFTTSWFYEPEDPYLFEPEYTGYEFIDTVDVLAEDWIASEEYPERSNVIVKEIEQDVEDNN